MIAARTLLLAALCAAPGCQNPMNPSGLDMIAAAPDLSASVDLSGPPNGPVPGPLDTHCDTATGIRMQPTSMADCAPDLGGGTPDGGVDGGTAPVYGATLYNNQGYDDACKYRVNFGVSPQPLQQGVPATLLVTAFRTTGGAAAKAATTAEVFLSPDHPAPSAMTTTTEGPPGTYTIKPVVFDAPGKWTVRFHFYPQSTGGAADSPRGYAAFYVQVP